MKRSVFLLLDHYPHTGGAPGASHAFALEHARWADILGFEAFWLAEHHFQHLGTAPNPAVMLAAIAMRTTRLRLGPAVSVLPYRNPVFVAEDYAVVDLLSAGRLNMGVGCGSQPMEFEGLGIEFPDRWALFHRNLTALREMWAGQSLNVAPCQHPTPPIYVATTNVDNARAIGHNGDSIITLLAPGTETLRGLAQILEAHKKGLSEGGYSQGDAEVVVAQLAHIAPSEAEARQHAIPALSEFLAMLSLDRDSAECVYESMQRAATGCFGAPMRMRETITALEAEGVKHVAFITRFGAMDANVAQRSLRLLAPASKENSPSGAAIERNQAT